MTNFEPAPNQFSILESILFAYGESIKLQQLGEILGLNQEALAELIVGYEKKLLGDRESGLFLIKSGDEIQLGTKPENCGFLESFLKQDTEEELTASGLEVLTIVLYRGPISRPEIDFIRGVNSSYLLRVLLMRGLIAREKRGLSFFYRPSLELLKLLGLSDQSMLPEFEALNQKLNVLVNQTEIREPGNEG